MLLFLILLILSSQTHGSPWGNMLIATHAYADIAIQEINSDQPGPFNSSEIVITRAQLVSTVINNQILKMPQLYKPFWTITAQDLHVSDENCLAIDATLCNLFMPKHPCHNACITSGPRFVAYDSQSHRLYLDAGTDVSGTGGTPRFLFVADTKNMQIKYLNTVVGPYRAYLSQRGSYIAISSGYHEISVYNTSTGSMIKVHGNHDLDNIHWANDTELQYNDGIELSSSIIHSTNNL